MVVIPNLDRRFTHGFLAAGYRTNGVILELDGQVGQHVDRLVSGVDRPVPHTGGLFDLITDAQFHRGVRLLAADARKRQVLQDERFDGVHYLVVHDGAQVLVEDLFLTVRHLQKTLVGPVQFFLGQLIPQRRQPVIQGRSPGARREHNVMALQPDQFRADNLVVLAVLENAVLVDAGGMCKGVASHDGLVTRDRHTHAVRDEMAGAVNFVQFDVCPRVVVIRPHMDSHDDLFECCIAGALADSVEATFHLCGAGANGLQRVGGRHAEVVVAVHADPCFVDVGHAVHDGGKRLVPLAGHRKTYSVGNIHHGGARLDDLFQGAAQVVEVGARCVFGGIFHVVAQAASIADRVDSHLQHIVFRLAHLALQMDVGGAYNDMNAWAFGRFDGFRDGIDIGLDAARQGGDHRAAHLFGNGSDSREIARRRSGKPRLDHVHSQARQLVSDFELFGSVQATTWRLFTVSQRRIKNVDFSHQHLPL